MTHTKSGRATVAGNRNFVTAGTGGAGLPSAAVSYPIPIFQSACLVDSAVCLPTHQSMLARPLSCWLLSCWLCSQVLSQPGNPRGIDSHCRKTGFRWSPRRAIRGYNWKGHDRIQSHLICLHDTGCLSSAHCHLFAGTLHAFLFPRPIAESPGLLDSR